MSRSGGKPGGAGGKGTYGRIAPGGAKKQPRRRSSNGGDGTSASASSRKKAKTSHDKWTKQAKRYLAAQKGGGGKKSGGGKGGKALDRIFSGSAKGKSVPRAKHHAAKAPRTSIKARVSAAAARKGRKGQLPASSSKSKSKTAGRPGGSQGRPKKKSTKKKRPARYRMNISECNDDVYLQRKDVPWFEAEKGGRFQTNAPTADVSSDGGVDVDGSDGAEDRKPSANGKEGLRLPPEPILRQIDAELQSFGAYVQLSPSERTARTAFLDHVTELAVAQFKNIRGSGRHTRFDYEDTARGRSTGKHGNKGRRHSHRPFYLGAEGGAASLNEFEDEREEIHVAPFGSFATQAVCTFASDVDMCLWGVVEGGTRPQVSGGVEFVGEEDSENDEKDGRGDEEFVLDKTSEGCPLLTESALLRTMDAIQSAQSQQKDADNAAPKAGEKKDADGKAGDCLFFIDRVGEGTETQSAEVIDLSATGEGHADEMKEEAMPATRQSPKDSERGMVAGKKASAGKTNKAKAKADDFQFVIDTEGAKELGGEAESEESPDEQTREASADKLMESTDSVEAGKKAAEPSTIIANKSSEKKRNGPAESANEAKEKDETHPEAREDQDDDDFEPGTFSALGKSAKDAVDIRDDGSSEEGEDEVIVVDSDSEDDADKMSSYYARKEETTTNSAPEEATDAAADKGDPVILLDDDSSSEGDQSDYDGGRRMQSTTTRGGEVLELSLTSHKSAPRSGAAMQSKPAIGPTGKARAKVVSALQSLARQLRRSSFTHTLECRSRARVPIVNCGTRTGFEGDIAIGGHNGVDTSTYAESQVGRFRSFAPIVLLLKILMEQQGLDKPFTGGLGSYKLYVLVAYHIERHMAGGGADRPAEILISLLLRYGCVGSSRDDSTTDLEHLRNADGTLSSDGGMCELNNIFRIADCVDMFRECHARLLDRILTVDGFGGDRDEVSYLSCIIDCYRLRAARESSDRRSKLTDSICRPVARNHPGKVTAGRRIGKVFSKGEGQPPKRGPRGGLVPKKRPDVAAANALRGNRDREIIQRGLKNRKNKKKQMRDVALKSFASRQSF